MNVREAQPYLNSFINYEHNLHKAHPHQFKLERVKALLNHLGNPQVKLKVVHIAGTKGKGSTCAFTAHILQTTGYRVGLYTSPHINDFRERIRVLESNSQKPFQGSSTSENDIFPDCISEGEVCALLEELKSSLEDFRDQPSYGRLSYFEVLTVLAIVYFVQKQVDCAVFETGLGGRLDATNVFDSCVCGLTPINLEHTQLLGETCAEIAQEKVAIVKTQHQTVVVAPQPQVAYDVIEKHCQTIGARIRNVGGDIQIQNSRQTVSIQSFDVSGTNGYYHLRTSLLGSCQRINAATAIGIVESLREYGIDVNASSIEHGIAQTSWPGRFEIVQQHPFVIFDCAHTPNSCEELINTINELFPDKKVIVVLGLMQDKNILEICLKIKIIAKAMILTKADTPRAYDFTEDDKAQIFPNTKFKKIDCVTDALEYALSLTNKEDIVLITGSIYVVGEGREYFKRTAKLKQSVMKAVEQLR